MKRSKITVLLLTLALLVGITLSVGLNASAATKVTESDFITAPEKTLVKGVDYEYSFALVGDTQILNLHDVENGTSNMKALYNWIIANQQTFNIQYVMGLGDITQTFSSSTDSESVYAKEWANAKEAISLLNGEIPYSLIRGNHDVSTGFNSTFGIGSEYYENLEAMADEGNAGFLPEYTDETNSAYKIETTWRRLTVGEDKYIIMTFDWAPSKEAIAWANEIISANPDHKIIVNIHQFLASDGSITDDEDAVLPHEQIGDENWGEAASSGGTELPRTLWDEALSKYDNVEMILCGHVDVDDIVTTQLRGNLGNTVTCMLINPQGIDVTYDAGMVAMLYISADGNVANVEYISTTRASDSDNDTGAYLKAKNQFSVKLEYEDGWTKTKYGYAPTEDVNSYTFLSFQDDDGLDETEMIYRGGFNRWINDDATAGVAVDARNLYQLGSYSVRKDKNYAVLMTKAYDGSSDGNYVYIGEVSGTLTLDLNGNIFTTGNKPVFSVYARTSYDTNTFNVIGGSLEISGSGPIVALQTTTKGDGGNINVNFDDVDFFYDNDNSASVTAPIVTTYPGNEGYSSKAVVKLTDCNIDVYNNAPSGAITLFNLNDTYANQKATVSVSGGSITGASGVNPTLASVGDGDEFTLIEGVKLYIPSGAAAPGTLYEDVAGQKLYFKLMEEGEKFDIYELSVKETAEPGSRGEIDIWLIAGQSNASGYAADTLTDSVTDSRYVNGFDDVLYFGSADDNVVTSFVPVTVGLGAKSNYIGAEVGIASMLGGSGKMNAVIKFGRGSSYLYPDTNNTVSVNYGTWTSPSYIKENEISTSGNKTGQLYNDFINTVLDGIELLVAEGYTPVIRGMWWMQGEAETWREALASEYDELLTAFIDDVRIDLSDISGQDLSDMPFVLGTITVNDAKDEQGNYTYSQPPYISEVVAAQYAVASKVSGVYTVDTSELNQKDAWHYMADDQQYLGEQFVSAVILAEGKYSVTVNGKSVSISGGGAYSVGDTVNVVITAENGFVIRNVTYTDDNGSSAITLSEGGEYSFVMPSSNVVFEVDAYDPGAVDTIYGTIPSAYTNADTYPFVVFKSGEFYNAYKKWNDLLQAGYSILDINSSEMVSATVLVRRDYSTSEDSANSQNLYLFEGKLIIDLDKHTLTRGSKHLFQIMAKKQSAPKREADIKIINGTILADGSTPFVINTNTNEKTVAQTFNFTFEGVTFGLAQGSSVANLVFVTYTGGTVETAVNASFSDCVFDLTNATQKTTLFNLKEASGSAKTAKVIVSDSVIKTQSIDYLSMYSVAATDKVGYGDGVTLELPASNEAPTETYTDSYNVSYQFSLKSSGDKVSVYELKFTDTASERTQYGVIPGNYTDSQTYPFVFFRGGEFIAAYEKWNDFLSDGSKLFSDTLGRDGVLLVRRSYSTSEDSGSSQNLYTIAGNLLIDLNEKTLTRGSKHLFQIMAKYSDASSKAASTNITIINGTILAGSSTPFVINTNKAAGCDDHFYFTFDNVTFGLASGSTVTNLVFVTYTDGSYNTQVSAVFNDCVFDITGATKKTTIFNMKESSGGLKTSDITVNGGTFKVDNSGYFNMYTLASSGDAIIFGKGSDGKYASLVMPIGQSVPTATYPVTNEGYSYGFGAPASVTEGIKYTLCPEELADLKISSNVTIYSDFVFNIYIPVLENIEKVTVDGKTVILAGLKKTIIDDAQYYVLSRDVAASCAAEDMVIKISVKVGTDIYNGKWTMSVVRYAKNTLATEQTEITYTLIRDMLSYIGSAYEYFASTGAISTDSMNTAISAITAIIGEDYDANNAPVMNESAVADTDGMTEATVALGAEIALLFRPEYDAEKYVFKMNGQTLDSEVSSDGTYIIVKTYAYGIRGTVEYTIDGTDIYGSYNLKSYYDYMASEGDGSDELMALLSRLMKYSESAELYRNEVNA